MANGFCVKLMQYEEDDYYDPVETQEDTWAVVNVYFKERGLVRQQIASFDEFAENTIHELVCDTAITRSETIHNPDTGDAIDREYEYKFGQTYLSPPNHVTADGTTKEILPNQARMCNLTYAAPLYADTTFKTYEKEDGGRREVNASEPSKRLMGYIPIMLRSRFCRLHTQEEQDLPTFGECPYDQGGYFVISGSEKVLVAQEKMSNNQVRIQCD